MHSAGQRVSGLLRHRALLPLAALLVALLRAATDPETDLFWMAREGQQVLAGGGFTHPDHWSWAPVPGDFVPTSPLWEVLAGLSWQHLGRFGLVLLTVVTLTLCGLGLGWVARSLGAAEPASMLALLLCVAVEPASWTGRAALPALVLLLVVLIGFHRLLPWLVRQPLHRAVAVVAGGAFAIAWLGIALHGSWTAYSLAVVAGLLWLAFGHGRRATTLAISGGGAALIGASTGPLGPSVWRQAGRVASAGHGVITEWSSPWALGGAALGAYVAGSLLLLLSLRALRRGSHDRPPVALLLVLAGVAQVAGFTAERFSFLAVAVLMPALSVALSRGLPTRLAARLEPRLGERLHERYWRTLLTAVALAFLPVAVVLAPTTYAVLDAPGLAALSPGCSLFSDDGTGSAAVLVRPDVKPMIDGRLDYWGPARMIEVRDVLWRPLPLTLVPAGANCVALPAGSYPALAQALGTSPAWRATGSTGPVRSWVHR